MIDSSQIISPQIVETEALITARIHLTVPRSEIGTVMGPAITEILSTLASQDLSPAGPWFTHHTKLDPQIFDFDVCFPITSEVKATGRVTSGTLRAAKVARTIYQGSYEGLAHAWAELHLWVKANGHTPDHDLWERYLYGPESNPDPKSWKTQLNRPLLT